MNKINFTLAKILNILQALEGIIKGHSSFNNMKKLQFSSFFPRKRQTNKKKVENNPNKILNPFRDIGKWKKVNDPKPKGKCFHYGVESH